MTVLVIIWLILLVVVGLIYWFPSFRTSRDMVKLYRVRPKGAKSETSGRDHTA
jgi:uncharacterized iron-regulated membrane protein